MLSAYLENFKPCGYFLRIKKTSGKLNKFKVTQGSFLTQGVATLHVVRNSDLSHKIQLTEQD